MSLKLDVDYLISIKKNVRDKFKAVDGLNELIEACHNRSNVLTAKIAKEDNVDMNKKELEKNNETCGILNVLCDILLSFKPEDDAKLCEKSEPWEAYREAYIGGECEYEPERKS
jgi:hypothetical protein